MIGSLNLSQTQWARNVVQVSAAVCGEERCVTRQITAAWETIATQAIIYPYITYCNSTWSSTYVTNLNRIYCLQKRAVRAITNSDYRAHSAPLFSKLGILNIYQINTFQIAKLSRKSLPN